MDNGVKYNHKYDAYEITPLDTSTLSRDEITRIGIYEDEIKSLKNKINDIIKKHYTDKNLILSRDNFNNIFKKSLKRGAHIMPITAVGIENLRTFNGYVEELLWKKNEEIKMEKENYECKDETSLS